MNTSALIFLLAGQYVCLIASVAATLRAGAVTANSTPPLGIEINGGTAPVFATLVHDELHARMLVLDDGAPRLAFVVVGNCLIDRAVFATAKVLSFQHMGMAAPVRWQRMRSRRSRLRS